MDKELSPQEKIDLITSHLQEVLKPEIIEDAVLKQNRPLKIYWGTATTGRPHLAYFVAMIKIAHFLKAGCKVKILLADVHGFMDALKSPIELIQFRAEYYRLVITSLLKAVGVPIDRLEFVLGSSYQLSSRYAMDLLRLSTVVTEHDAKKAGAEVVKQTENPTLSGLLYPLMQALDEEHLDVDVQFGGVDQRKILVLAAEQLPRIGYKERGHLMNPMVPGLQGAKMSASDPDSKIDILDTPDAIKKKIKKAYAAPKELEGNGMISFVEYVLLPATALKHGKARFVADTREGEEPLIYEDIETLKKDYVADKLTPQSLKGGVRDAIIALLEPIQKEYAASPEWQEIDRKAYPPPEVKKKEKKVKDRGSRYPGATAANSVEAKPDGHIEGDEKAKDKLNLSSDAEMAMKNLDIKSGGTAG